jgi:hypothetical protein
MIVVASHEIAEQITKASKLHPWSVTKSPTIRDLRGLIGDKSMLNAEVCRLSICALSNHRLTILS